MDRDAIVKDQEASGESVTQYSAKRRIRPNNFYNWRNKHRAEGLGFARVETTKRVSLELEVGIVIRV
jgi:transposase-like protein